MISSALRGAAFASGVLTGRGADIIVIDDPVKPEEALSQTQRQAANAFCDEACSACRAALSQCRDS